MDAWDLGVGWGLGRMCRQQYGDSLLAGISMRGGGGVRWDSSDAVSVDKISATSFCKHPHESGCKDAQPSSGLAAFYHSS